MRLPLASTIIVSLALCTVGCSADDQAAVGSSGNAGSSGSEEEKAGAGNAGAEAADPFSDFAGDSLLRGIVGLKPSPSDDRPAVAGSSSTEPDGGLRVDGGDPAVAGAAPVDSGIPVSGQAGAGGQDSDGGLADGGLADGGLADGGSTPPNGGAGGGSAGESGAGAPN